MWGRGEVTAEAMVGVGVYSSESNGMGTTYMRDVRYVGRGIDGVSLFNHYLIPIQSLFNPYVIPI